MLSKWVKRIERILRWVLLIIVARYKTNKVIVLSNYIKNYAVNILGINPNKISIAMPIFVIDEEEKRLCDSQEIKVSNKHLNIGYVGRFDPRKRIDRLLHTISLLKDSPVHLHIAGDGPMRPKLEQMINKLEINNKVTLLGMVENPYTLLKTMDLYVLPSDNEAFSNSILEAMYAGLPVCVFSKGIGAVDFIENQKNGFIVDSCDELAEIIKDLIFKKEQLKLIGGNAKEHVKNDALTTEDYLKIIID